MNKNGKDDTSVHKNLQHGYKCFLLLAQICIFCILLLTMNLTPIYANPICNISLARCSLRRHLLMHSKRYIFEKVIFQVSGKTCATNKNTKMFKYCFTYIIHPLHSYFLLNFDPIRKKIEPTNITYMDIDAKCVLENIMVLVKYGKLKYKINL